MERVEKLPEREEQAKDDVAIAISVEAEAFEEVACTTC